MERGRKMCVRTFHPQLSVYFGLKSRTQATKPRFTEIIKKKGLNCDKKHPVFGKRAWCLETALANEFDRSNFWPWLLNVHKINGFSITTPKI